MSRLCQWLTSKALPLDAIDPIYFFDESKVDYVPFTKAEYDRVVSGHAKL